MLPWTLLAKPHNTRDGSHTAAQLIDDRLTLWQLGLHESLHQQTHTDTAPQPLRPPSKQEHKQRMGSRATRVATLVANRETSRALDTLIDQQHIIIDNRVAGAVQALYPLTANHPTYPHGQGINADAIDRVAAQIPRALRRMGRLTIPGILGLRPEHLLPLLDGPVHTEHFQLFMGCLALGFIHEQALAFLRRGQISPKPKGDTYRPLLLSNVLRRLAIKALMMAEQEAVQNLTHIRQYGVGAPDGASKLTKLLRTLTDQHPDLCVLSLDICAAFQNISRASIAANLHDHPIVDQAFRSWYPHNTTTNHRITLADGSHRTIQANQGLDQGCPLASYGYTKGNEEDQNGTRWITQKTSPRKSAGLVPRRYLRGLPHTSPARGACTCAHRIQTISPEPARYQDQNLDNEATSGRNAPRWATTDAGADAQMLGHTPPPGRRCRQH